MRHARPIGAFCFIAALLLAACGDDAPVSAPSPEASSDAVPTETPVDASGLLAHLVPSDRRDIELVLGFPDSNPSPLMGQPDDGEADGALPDLVDAALDLLSLSGRYEAVPQGEEVDRLEAGELHVYVAPSSGVHGIADRTSAVTFLDEEDTFLIREGLDVGTETSDLCGLRIGYDDDSIRAALEEWSATCVSLHDLQPIDIQDHTEAETSALDAAVAGELDAAPTGTFYGEWLIGEHPGLSLGGPILGPTYLALLVGKNNGLVGPLSSAIDELVANGTYERIMSEHGVPSLSPNPSRVNPEPE